MTAGRILEGKSKDIITISPKATMGEATLLLCQKRIGALLVVDKNGALIGIFTERDVVRALGSSSENSMNGVCLKDPIEKYMITNVITASPSDSINDIMVKMTKGRFRHVPVMDNDKLVGMISIGDVIKTRIEMLEQETAAMRDYIMMG